MYSESEVLVFQNTLFLDFICAMLFFSSSSVLKRCRIHKVSNCCMRGNIKISNS